MESLASTIILDIQNIIPGLAKAGIIDGLDIDRLVYAPSIWG
jgi:hypothetical protein